MATGKAQFAYHSTIATAGTAETVTLSSASAQIEIINRSGSAEIYYTTDGSTPTVAGNDCYVVPAVVGSDVRGNAELENNQVVVKLISSGTPTYSVQAVF